MTSEGLSPTILAQQWPNRTLAVQRQLNLPFKDDWAGSFQQRQRDPKHPDATQSLADRTLPPEWRGHGFNSH